MPVIRKVVWERMSIRQPNTNIDKYMMERYTLVQLSDTGADTKYYYDVANGYVFKHTHLKEWWIADV